VRERARERETDKRERARKAEHDRRRETRRETNGERERERKRERSNRCASTLHKPSPAPSEHKELGRRQARVKDGKETIKRQR